MKLTDNQRALLTEMYQEGLEAICGHTAADLHEQNMSLCFASELAERLGKSRQSIGGILSGLVKRGLVVKGDKRSKRDFGPDEHGGQWELWLTAEGIDAICPPDTLAITHEPDAQPFAAKGYFGRKSFRAAA